MKIREILIQDFEEWINLRYSLWPYHTIEELRKEAEEIYKRVKLDYMFFAAEDNGKLVGFIEVSLRDFAVGCRTKKVGFIEGWYVKSDYRKKGIGKLLVEIGENWAINKGCIEMGSDTNESYPISPIAHKALGYEEVEIPLNFRKQLI